MADRRYDEKEVAAILKRAAEIQSGLAPEIGADGMTLAELEKVATEVGIDPATLQRAANELGRGEPSLTGEANPNSLLLERTVDGVLSDESWDDVVTRLRRHVGKPGGTTVHGNTHEWTGGWDTGVLTLSATVRAGRTRFKLMGETTGGAILAWTLGPMFGLLAALIIGAVLSKSGNTATASWLSAGTIFMASFLVTALSLKVWKKKAQLGMRRVFEDVTAMTVAPEPGMTLPASQTVDDDLRETLSNT